MKIILPIFAIIFIVEVAKGQFKPNDDESKPNYDESKTGHFTLPNPLTTNSLEIKIKQDWIKNKQFWINQFSENVYGFTPQKRLTASYKLLESKEVFEGKAIRSIVEIRFKEIPKLKPISVLVYSPNIKNKKFPLIIGLNFMGNQGCTDETDIPINENWARSTDNSTVVGNRFTEKSKGFQKERWNLKEAVSKGFMIATAYYGDIEADHKDGWKTGIRSYLGDSTKPNNWGAIGAWAWGLSRMLDLMHSEFPVQQENVFLTGHSRLGKAALWAAVQDERFTMINSNCSGEGGAALSRRNFGETIETLNTFFPHWFCHNYRNFNENPSKSPVDHHILLALIAPRPLYVTAATEDLWADPLGMFLALKESSTVYNLFDIKAMQNEKFPNENTPIGSKIRFHNRKGKHDITPYDWEQYYKFIKENLK
ncbi:MAG: acetylxylan esterase [Leadbetterella sp.]